MATPVVQRAGETAEEAEDRFWARVRHSSACWEWQGARDSHGYGALRWEGRTERTHRVAWVLARGPLAPGQKVAQTCKNRVCCRPDHLAVRGPVVDDPAGRAAEARERRRKRIESSGHLEQRGPNSQRRA